MRVCVSAAAALLFVAPAGAADIGNVRALDIAVRGTIAEHCKLANVPNMAFGDITRPGLAVATQVALDCNVPINVTIRAQNGGLANDALPHGQGPYAGTLPYILQVQIPVRRPAPAIVSQAFASRDLVAGQSISSAGGIAVDGMALNIALGLPGSEAGLLGGRYGEVIEISVTPG
jgi:spore coat protein U-like protein